MTQTINGRYQIEEKIGQGGMGIVYRATDRLTGDTVALKYVIKKQPDNDEAYRLALAHEFQTLAGLRHPHIISVLDFGFDEETRPFFTMAYLSEMMTILEAGQERSFDQKIELIQQLLQALAYLHRRGVLHRDIKPDNVLFDSGGVRLLDFGLAATDQVSGNDSMGTPLYLAPELFDGQDYSKAADLYAVGVLLFQLLTGEHPFAPFDYKFMDRVLDAEPDLAGVDERLQPFLTQLLAKQPNNRFASAPDTLAALAQALGKPLPEETPAIRESYLQAATFVGRDVEIATLHKALHGAMAKKGSAWLIGGESGIGKSRFVDELRIWALVQGFEVVHSRGTDGGRSVPYHFWRNVLQRLVVTLDPIDDLTASIIKPIVPTIEQLLNRSVVDAPELEESASQIRLFTTLARLIWQAKRPLLLIFEDLHWAEASLLPIPYLTRFINECQVVLIATYRTDERPTLAAELPEEINQLTLERLSSHAMAQLSASMLGNEVGRDQRVFDMLQKETEGNAFFFVEVVRALAEEAGQLAQIGTDAFPDTLLTHGIQNIVQRRISKLPTQAFTLLCQTAVAGRTLDIPLIKALAGNIRVEHEWLTLCADAAILAVQDGVWQFAHGKIRDGLLAQLSAAETIAYNQKVAETIEQLYSDDDSHAIRLVFHWRAANNQQKERSYLIIAAKQAAKRYAHRETLRYVNRSLDITTEAALEQLFELYTLAFGAYKSIQMENAHDAARRMLEIANTLDDNSKRVRAWLCLSDYYLEIGQTQKQEAMLTEALAPDKNIVVPRQRAQLLSALSQCLGAQRRLEAALQFATEAQIIIEGAELKKEKAAIMRLLSSLYSLTGDAQKSLTYVLEAYHLVQAEGTLIERVMAIRSLALSYLVMGRHDLSNALNLDALELIEKTGNVAGEMPVLNNLGLSQAMIGQYKQAIETSKRGILLSQQIGSTILYGYGLNNIAVAYHKSGNYEKAKAYFVQAIDQKRAVQDGWSEAYSWNKLGILLVDQGEYEEALKAFQTADSLLQTANSTPTKAETWAGLAYVFAKKDELDKARSYADNAWHFIEEKTFNCEWEWAQSSLYIYHVFDYIGDPRQMTILDLAHTQLQTFADKITDQELHATFLHSVPENREIIRLYKAMQAEKADTALSI